MVQRASFPNPGSYSSTPFAQPAAQQALTPGWSDTYALTAPAPAAGPAAAQDPMAALFGLQAKRETLKQDYCAIMQELKTDPRLYRIQQEIRGKHTPRQQYLLPFGFIVDRFGLTAIVDVRERLPLDDVRKTSPDKFGPHSIFIGDFPGYAAAKPAIERRIKEICQEIVSAYESAAANQARRSF